jgi:hypothetical protein
VLFVDNPRFSVLNGVMDQATLGAIWALICIAAVAVLVLAARRIGRLNAAAWMLAVAALLLAGEDPWQLVFMASTPGSDTDDGVLGVVKAHTLAHMIGGAGMSVAGLVLSVWVAHTGLRRGQHWAWWALLTVLLIIGGTDTYELTIYPHGLPLFPTPSDGNRGFGWPSLAAGFAVWALALGFSYGPIFRSGNNIERTTTSSPLAGRRMKPGKRHSDPDR